MADKRITELPEADPLNGTEPIAVVQGGDTKRSVVSEITVGKADDPHGNEAHTDTYVTNTDADDTYSRHVGDATTPITDPATARPSGDGMLVWFTDFSGVTEDEPDNMEPQDVQFKVNEPAGSYPDATGAAAGKVAETDGADGWTLIDTPSGGDVPSPHSLGGAHHSSDTLANLNAKISDGALDDASDPRDPTAHASSHEPGGSDALEVDAAAGTGSLRTLGTGSGQALPGDTDLAGAAPVQSVNSETGDVTLTAADVGAADDPHGNEAHDTDYAAREPDEAVFTDDHTLALTDRTSVVEMDSSSANTVTVPPNSSVAFPVGTLVEVCQVGAGATTIAEGSGVTVQTPDGLTLTLRGQWSTVSLRQRATDEWVVSGDLEAS